MSRPGRAGSLALALALGAVLYLPGLGREILRHPLEAKYALAAREMLDGGPLLVAHLFGQIYPDKPPLYFWATAGLARLRGGRLDELTARLPAVAGALATLAVTWALGRALFDAGTGLAAAAILATSNLFFWYARQGHPDQFLTAGVALACLGLWRSFQAPPGPRRTGWIALAYAAMGLGVLSKGLLGLVLPLLGAGLYLAVTGPPRAVPRRLGLWPGGLAFLAVVLAWFGPAVARHGIGYLHETIVHQHVQRYARTWVHAGPWYYYFGEFAAGFLPWSLFVPGALVLAWRTRRAAAATAAGAPPAPYVFPLAWFVAGFVFLSLSTSKRGAYLLPLYPAAALAVGWLWTRAVRTETRSRWIGVPVALLAGVAAALALVVLAVPARLLPGNMVDTLLPAGTGARAVGAALLLAGAAAVWATWRRGRPAATLAAIVAVQCVCLHAVARVRAPQYEARFPARELAARLAVRVPAGEPVLSLLGDYDFIVAFYLDRRITPLPGPSELLAAAARRPGYALLDNDDRALLAHPAVHALAEGRLGPKRIVLVQVGGRPRPPG
jgi:4-amino-4-deoxy-L-arabinose transferase-like glycosyltransferase